MRKQDLFTLPLPLDLYQPEVAAPQLLPNLLAAPPEPTYLDWRLWRSHDKEESWITKWHQDGLLLSAKVEALDLINPDDDEHLWNHRVTVHSYDAQSEEVAIISLDEVQSPLYDLDIFPMLDDVVHALAEKCVEFVRGKRSSTLLH